MAIQYQVFVICQVLFLLSLAQWQAERNGHHRPKTKQFHETKLFCNSGLM